MHHLLSRIFCCAAAITFATTIIPLSAAEFDSKSIAYEAEYEATYKGGWIPITVEAKRSLKQQEDGQWRLAFEVYSSIVDVSEISQMELHDQVFIPYIYDFKTSGFATKERRTQIFHWDEKKVWGDHKDQFWKYELISGTQNSISYQEQLRLDLINGKTNLAYPVTYKHKLKRYEFEIIGEKTLQGANGPIKTIEVKQKINKHNKLDNRIWFAVDQGYLMVKLKQKRGDGNTQVITLKKAVINGQSWQAFK